MPLQIRCQCGRTLTVPEQRAGTQVLCPVCSQVVDIPATQKNDARASQKISGVASQDKEKPSPPKPSHPLPPPIPSQRTDSAPGAAAGGDNEPEPPPIQSSPQVDRSQTAGPLKAAQGPQKPETSTKPVEKSGRPDKESSKQSDSAKSDDTKSPSKNALPVAGSEPTREKDASRQSPPQVGAKENGSGDSSSTFKRPSPPSHQAKRAPQPPPRPRRGSESKQSPQKSSPTSVPQPPPLPGKTESIGSAEEKATPTHPPVEKKQPQTSETTRDSKRDDQGTTKAAAAATEAEQEELLRGVEHDPGKKATVYQLGAGMAVLSLTGLYPAVMEVVRHFQDFESTGIEPWAYFVFLFGGVHLVYALYLVQLPDWSTTWVVMFVAAITATIFAGGLGISLMGSADNEVILAMGLGSLHASGRLSLWCFLMTTLWSTLTYFFTRFSLRWHKAFQLAVAPADNP